MTRPKIHNLKLIPEKFMDDPHFESSMTTKYLGALAGSKKIYVNIDHVKPGAKSAKYHSHTMQEEFFLILKGEGTLRFQDNTFPVKQGDFIAKPSDQGIAHKFINDGRETLEILDCGSRHQNDMVEYPDENMLYVKAKGAVYKMNSNMKDWSADPNQ